MTKILIIEDEIPAQKKLRSFIENLNSPTEIMAELETVQSALDFLKVNQPDLIISDIELLDGNAFEIYSQVNITCPIIFTTAYDQFLINAFETNGIAYLLKPFSQERFQNAWDKFIMLKSPFVDTNPSIQAITQLIQQNFQKKEFKRRFTIHKNEQIYFVATENILLFEADEGIVFAYDSNGKKHLLNETTLKEIEERLNPNDFFRINRSELIQKQHIEKIKRYNKNSLAIYLKGHVSHLKTSQNKTSSFREWIEK